MMFRFLRNPSLQRALLQAPRPIVPSSVVSFPATRSPLVIEKLIPSSPSCRHFHTTPSLSFAIRRRRRGQAVAPTPTSDNIEYDTDDEEDGQPEPGDSRDAVLDPIQFQQGGDALLEKIQVAMEPMQRANDHFFVSRGTEEEMGDFLLIDVGPVHGQYTLQIDLEQKCLVFQTPISGQYTYRLSESKGEWFNEIDGHAFEGLLVRDLIRQVKGIPKL
jgi:hypothetical protein